MKILRCFIPLLLLGVCCLGQAEISVTDKKRMSAAGMGLSGIADWSTQLPFLDLMHQSREWYDWRRRSTTGISLDKSGWVVSLARGVKAETIFLTTHTGSSVIYPHYIVRWEGKAKVSYGGCAKKVGKAHGGDRIAIGEKECFLGIEDLDKKDPIRNITIVPEEHIDAFDSGEIFNPDFIEKIGAFRALRFMDWSKTNTSEQQSWIDRPLPDDRSYAQKGVPIEVMLKLANKVLADPWFNMPHKADLDYFKQFALLVKKLLHPELKVFIEHSNETWNWIFPQAHHSLKAAKQLFGAEGDAFMQWQGMRTAQMCRVWKQGVFNDQRQRVVCILGAQLGWPQLEQAALDCPLWVKQGNPACVDGIDAIAVAGYFSGCLNGGDSRDNQKKVASWHAEGRNGHEKAFEQIVDGRHFECGDTLLKVTERYEYFVKAAKERGLVLLAYEGGQHITSNLGETQDDKRFIGFHIALNRSDMMKNMYQLNFKNWIDAGGALFMHFVDVEHFSRHGSWGALEYVTQETSPKWEALMEFNQTPCWWQGCK